MASKKNEYVLLDGYSVIRASEHAVCVRKKDNAHSEDLWLPRSAIEDGDMLEEGDTDIGVAGWLVEKEGLDV